MPKKPSVKILVGYHKLGAIIPGEVFVPIHMGRALATTASKDGAMRKEDYQWMIDNMIGDDTGDNISDLNRKFNEMTAIYWAWKNYDKLGNPDYIGFMHYRRHFIFNSNFDSEFDGISDHIAFKELNEKYIKDLSLDEESVIKAITDYDIILPPWFDIDKTFKLDVFDLKYNRVKVIKDLYADKELQFYDFDKTISILLDKYPHYKEAQIAYYDQKWIYFKNMFILKKEIFFEMCEIVFNVLSENERQLDYSKIHQGRIREIGHVAEIVLGIYFYKKYKRGTNRIKYLMHSYIKDPMIKILVGYHKPAYLLKNKILEPIHLGRSLATETSKDGAMSQEDYQWMYENMIGDDTGNNISACNRTLCEMTAIYWAWKNYDKLGNPDYIGFMHYRRHFIFRSDNVNHVSVDAKSYRLISKKYENDIGLDEQSIRNSVNGYDIIQYAPFVTDQTVYEQFTNLKRVAYDLDFNAWEKAIWILKELEPDYTKAINDYINGHEHTWFNVFVMKKDLFFQYAEWIFGIIEKLKQEINLDMYSLKGRRVLAFIAERFMGVWIKYNQKRLNLKIKRLPITFVQNTEISKVLFPAFSENNVAVFLSTDDNYANYAGVLIKSIINNSSKENNYDIVVLEEKLSEKSKAKLFKVVKDKANVSLRFYNVSNLMAGKSFHLCAHFTIATYYRLFAGSVFKNYDKIVYLDVDTIVLKDIAELYDVDIKDKFLAAVLDYGIMAKIRSRRFDKLEYFKDIVGVKEPFKEYFQAGVLVFNIKQFDKHNLEEKLLNTATENNFAYVDQDVFNRVCNGNVEYLDSSWNIKTDEGTTKGILDLLPSDYYSKYLKDRENPGIIHYASYNKPWKSPESDFAELWWKYARMLPFYEEIVFKNLSHRHFDVDLVKDALNLHKNKRTYWRYKILSKITFGKTRERYKAKRKAMKLRIMAVEKFLKK